jgi:hypothetical protein
MNDDNISPDRPEPRFDLDLKYGKDGERRIREVFDWLAGDDPRAEVKRKRVLDHRVYVETSCDRGRTGVYHPSGINVTTASVWVFVIDDTGIHIAIPTALIRQQVDDPSSKTVEGPRGTCPTRGVLIDFCVLLYKLKCERARHSDEPHDDRWIVDQDERRAGEKDDSHG